MLSQTNSVVTEGDNLTGLVTSLNTTMHQLLASLQGSIQSGIRSANQSLASTDELVAQALGAVLDIQQALMGAYQGLTSGKFST